MMTNPGFHSYQEIFSQPLAWAAVMDLIRGRATELRHFFSNGQFDQILYTGCGSNYYLALAAAAAVQQIVGISARGLPASELWLYPRSVFLQTGRTLLVTFFNDTATTETIRALETFRAKGGAAVMSVTGNNESPLAAVGDLNLVLPMLQGESITRTRGFSTLYLSTIALAALWSGNDALINELLGLPPYCKRLMDDYGPLANDIAGIPTLDRFYFLGSGPRYGLACELSLEMKEMSLSHSEPFHFFEFRHGPQSMVTPTTLIVGLVSETHHAQELQVLAEMRELGARALSVGDQSVQVAFGSGLSEDACNVLYLPFGQLLACHHGIGRGLDPDRPPNLEAVVKLP